MEQINEKYPEKPWELKPCNFEDLENKTRQMMGNEYWEKNKEDLIEKWKESVNIENKRIKLLRFLSEKDKVTLNEIYEAMGENNTNEVLKILAVMKFQKLIEGIDNRLITISDLGKEYLKNS
ncbi:hypothetical protein [Clostridium sp. BNL1100]|uniref:hypothetical protein n=1 Tax=Clostridium sp. BNL1100 TaxID=755731 RepID=UPI00024A7C7B|nr:hypothetical protein [Clostridium sp. BNL1100]AEY64951.1 hypothetical protein Clo1100_0680 [Clostridium sp. BNL1100]